jgi:hypothetical protein
MGASSLHLGPLQKSALEKNKCEFRYYDSNVVSFTSNRCKVDDVSCRSPSYILPVASHLDPSLVSAPDNICDGPRTVKEPRSPRLRRPGLI